MHVLLAALALLLPAHSCRVVYLDYDADGFRAVRPDGSGRIAVPTHGVFTSLSWSSTAQRFVAADANGMYVLDRTGSRGPTFAPALGDLLVSGGEWWPDGTKIAFTGEREPPYREESSS